jgi:hypothetical protein
MSVEAKGSINSGYFHGSIKTLRWLYYFGKMGGTMPGISFGPGLDFVTSQTNRQPRRVPTRTKPLAGP